MSEKKDKKVILFSTRFLQAKDKLFCDDNIDSPKYCCSPEYLKYFLSDNLPSEIVQYFNRLYYKSFFSQYKDEDGKSIINVEDNSKEIREKLWGNIPEVKYSKPLWMSFFSDLDKKEKLFEITVNKEKAKFEFKDKDVDAKSLLKIIQDNEGSIHNKNVVLNTDFGDSVDKRTIDRRFKIYELKTDNINNIYAYGVWCLGKPSNETQWYKALYEELKTQMAQKGDDFNAVKEVLFFLHDGDIGEKVPFKVNHYKATNDTFDFLDKEITLSVAIFQHSLSPIATALSNPDIDKALKSVQDEMEKGSKLDFLHELSDYVAYWHNGGKEEYLKVIENGQKKYEFDSLITKEAIDNKSKSVEEIFEEIKKLIDDLNNPNAS